MHYMAHSITKLCQGMKQRYEGWESIPMYDCSRKEDVFIVILECGYLSVCQVVLSSPHFQFPSSSCRFRGEQSLPPKKLGHYQA